MGTTQNVQIFQYKMEFKISMSKIPLGVSLAPPYPTVIYMEFKSRLLRANMMAKKKKKMVDGVRTRDPPTHLLKSMTICHGLTD